MIHYNIFCARDAEEVAGLLGEVFAQRDPPAVALGLTTTEFQAFVRLLCPKAAVDGLTMVARSAETGELVGALLTEDSSTDLPLGVEQLSPKFDPIFDILGQLDAEFRSGRPPTPGESLHLFLLGVSLRYAGQGISQQLVARCLTHGVKRGYRVAVTEATNTTSQHIFRKQGFVQRVLRSYQEHRFNGRSYFASIAEQGGPMLMEKRLAER